MLRTSLVGLLRLGFVTGRETGPASREAAFSYFVQFPGVMQGASSQHRKATSTGAREATRMAEGKMLLRRRIGFFYFHEQLRRLFPLVKKPHEG